MALELTQSLTEMSTRPVRTVDDLTTFMCRLSWNLGASTSTSWNPQGLSRPVMGLLLFTFSFPKYLQEGRLFQREVIERNIADIWYFLYFGGGGFRDIYRNVVEKARIVIPLACFLTCLNFSVQSLYKPTKCTFYKLIFYFLSLLRVSKPRVHLQEDSCTYRYRISCLHARV